MFKIIAAQENYLQIAIALTNHNPPVENVFPEDHQIEEAHKVVHKIDLVDQKVKKISIETITPDPTQIEVIIQIILETVFTQTLVIETIPKTVHETLQITEIETL